MASTISKFRHFQIPLEEIEIATDHFAKTNIIGRGGFGNVYRGKLMRSGKLIKFSARRLNRKYGQGDVEFMTELSMLSSLNHENVVSLIGFCDEKGEKIIVNRYYSKGSLSTYLSKPVLTWSQRMNICLGIARSVEYIHDKLGRSYVIHRNINSSTILLDKNWEPKLSGFEFSIKHSVDRKNQVFFSEAMGTYGYIDPDINESGGVTHKSDIYSLGIVVLEILCGRKANEDDTFLASLARLNSVDTSANVWFRIDERMQIVKDMLHPDLFNQLGWRPLEKIYYLALFSCVHMDRSRRPDAFLVVDAFRNASDTWKRKTFDLVSTGCLEILSLLRKKFIPEPGNDWDFPIHGNDETDEDNVSHLTIQEIRFRDVIESALFNHGKVKNFGHLRIQLKEIRLAIYNFRGTRTCWSHELGVVYRAELECFDHKYSFSIEDKVKSELPKRDYSVQILCIRDREDVFKKEIQILGTCKHKNVQPLLGFCDKDRNMILVYKHTYDGVLSWNLESLETWKKCLKICVDVARGLNYLQNKREDKKMVIHRDINSGNIVLNDRQRATIVGFNNSVLLPTDQDDEAFQLDEIVGNKHYIDPEYAETGRFRRESDIYSFGVVMFELFCGSLVSTIMLNESHKDEGLTQLVRRWFDEGIIMEKLASVYKKENGGNRDFLHKGPNKDSLDTFLKVAYTCLAEKQNKRPQIKVVLKKLKKALRFQKNHKDIYSMSFQVIKKATQNFSNRIGGGGFGGVYLGNVGNEHGIGDYTIVVKRLDKSNGQREEQYYNELQILHEYKHDNIIGLLGFSNETDEKLIVYEHATKGSLEKYLDDVTLTWRNRLKICIDVAIGLDFIHGGCQGQDVVIHRDLKSANILLFNNWKAKLGDFGLSLISAIDMETNFTIDRVCGTEGYVDPLYSKSKILTIESDVYSFGVVLFEILYGNEIYKIPIPNTESLLNYIEHHIEEGKQEEIVFEAIKKYIVPQSLTKFLKIVYGSLADDREKRPTSKEVLSQLKEALELQDADMILEPEECQDLKISSIHMKSKIKKKKKKIGPP